jgi:hypothetical protein
MARGEQRHQAVERRVLGQLPREIAPQHPGPCLAPPQGLVEEVEPKLGTPPGGGGRRRLQTQELGVERHAVVDRAAGAEPEDRLRGRGGVGAELLEVPYELLEGDLWAHGHLRNARM